MLKNKVALITGASRGIGKATALLFAKNGAKLIINSKTKTDLEKLAEEIRTLTNIEPILLPYDVSCLDEIKNTFNFIHKEIKQLDIVVNNAGILEDALLGMISKSNLEKVINVNLYSVIYHMQYSARLMQKKKSGSIINLSSIIGRFGNEGQTVYAASKAGVIGATMSASKELAKYNIRVNAIAPGFINTDMTKSLAKDKFEERLNSIKMQRIGEAEEVANAILFLASEMSSYVTGQVIGVDGGMIV